MIVAREPENQGLQVLLAELYWKTASPALTSAYLLIGPRVGLYAVTLNTENASLR